MIDWRHWHNEPFLVGGVIFLAWLHAILAGPLRERLAPGEPYPRAKAFRFHASLVIFYLAVGSPLDQVGEGFLFSAHMTQHLILIYPAAVLFLTGLPAWMIDPVLRLPSLRRLVHFLTRPLICGLIFSLTYSLWHMPALYDWALHDKVVHVGEHIMLFGCALFYWWPLLSPSRVFPPANYGTQMLYNFFVEVAMTPAFVYLVFSDDVLYPTYEYAPRLYPNFSAADDQLLAGTLMKIVGMIVALIAFGWSFYHWSREEAPKAAVPEVPVVAVP